MQTDLARFVENAPITDTHEHLRSETSVTGSPPDILVDLFDNYVSADLVVAGATPEAVARLIDSSDPNLMARFLPVRSAWECCQHTGYGEATRILARRFYDIDEITPEAIESAKEKGAAFRRPRARIQLLRQAGIDHIQVDDFSWKCVPDMSGPDFFLYDLSWESFCSGRIDTKAVHEEVGIEVRDLKTLRAAMAALFAKYGACAIAVKSQHAYNRALHWEERDEADVARVLGKVIAGKDIGEGEKCVLGDWCWARASSSPRSITCRSRYTRATMRDTAACRSSASIAGISAPCSRNTRRRGSC
jgi:hypothetical protein